MPKKSKVVKPKKSTKKGKLEVSAPRRLKKSQYKTLRLSKRIRSTQPKISGSWKLLGSSFLVLKKHWRLFGTLTIIYGLLTFVLVRGVGGGTNLSDIKSSFQGVVSGKWASLTTGTVLYGYLLGSAGSSATETGSVYQSLLIIIMSLAVIWSLRQVTARTSIRARDAFYKGMYPLVPFLLVMGVIGLQLLPLMAGSWLYSTVMGNGIAVTLLEKILWGTLFFLLALLSLYMIASSLFALYIVTLPDMTPMQALRSARQLVLHRRWTILRKIIFLPIALLIASAVLMVPLIILLTGAAQWVFLLLSMFVLVLVHSYMYSLYRELL